MKEQKYTSLFKAFTQVYGFWTGAIVVFMVTLPLIFNNPFTRGVETDTIDVILFIIIGMAFAGSIVVGISSFMQLQTARNTLLITLPQHHALHHRLRRYTSLGYAGVALAGFWFMPLMWIRMEELRFLSPWTAIFFLVMLLVYYYRSYRAFDAEMALLSPEERLESIQTGMSQVHSGWWSLLGLAFIMIVTDVFRNGFVLAPQTNDEWMTSAMIFVTTALFVNQLIQLWYYRQQGQRLGKEA